MLTLCKRLRSVEPHELDLDKYTFALDFMLLPDMFISLLIPISLYD